MPPSLLSEEDEAHLSKLPRPVRSLARATVTVSRLAKQDWRVAVAELLVPAALGMLLSTVQVYVGKHPEILAWIFGYNRPLFVGAMILLAYGLVLLKKHFQTIYGTVEVVFACVSAWQVIGNLSANRTANVVALGAALYVTTRGMTNLVEGFNKVRGIARS